MKKIFVPYIQQVPQWKQCYYDKKIPQKLIKLSEKTNQLKQQINLKIHEILFKYKQEEKSQKVLLQRNCQLQYLSRQRLNLQNIHKETHRQFYQLSLQQMQNIYFFVQYKSFEIKDKLDRLLSYKKVVQKDDPDYLTLLENTFIQVHYLKRMIKYNRNLQLSLIQQYQLSLYQYQTVQSKQIYSRKMDRMELYVQNMERQIANVYMITQTHTESSAIEQHLTLHSVNKAEANSKYSQYSAYTLGFIMGILMVISASLIFFKNYNNISLDTSKQYKSYFPVWRGASYFIFYQWLLAFVFLFLERTQINYKMILSFDNQTLPKSRSIFLGAQIMTIIYLILFCLYMLDLSQVTKTNFKYYGHIMWLVLIIYYLVPIPFTNYHGTMYFLRLMFKIVISCLPFIKCDPIIIWLSQQIVSFSQPFADFGYTICKLQNIKSQCLQIPLVTFIILVIFFSYRIIQNFKMYYQSGWNIIPPFWGLWRAIAGLITSITSYYYRKILTQNGIADNWFIAWIVTAAISTCIATFVDFKGDWGILSGGLLRKKLMFGDTLYFYYICMIIDFILRANWALNISPNIVKNFGIFPYYLIMIVSYLELFRRCLWNIFRIQFDHAINVDTFQATLNDVPIQNTLKERYIDGIPKITPIPEADLRKKAQFQLLTASIKCQSSVNDHIEIFIDKNYDQIQEIQKQLSYLL